MYKQWSMIVPEHRSIKMDAISCEIAHLVISCFGVWCGYQSFIESIINYCMGFRFINGLLSAFFEVTTFGGFAAINLSLDTAPPVPTILPCATVFISPAFLLIFRSCQLSLNGC